MPTLSVALGEEFAFEAKVRGGAASAKVSHVALEEDADLVRP